MTKVELAKGPNFVVTPQPPNIDYIAAIEAVSSNLTEWKEQELKADVNSLLKKRSISLGQLN